MEIFKPLKKTCIQSTFHNFLKQLNNKKSYAAIIKREQVIFLITRILEKQFFDKAKQYVKQDTSLF